MPHGFNSEAWYKVNGEKTRITEDALLRASHHEMLEFTATLHSSDKGKIAELWYDRMHLYDVDSVRHMHLKKDLLNEGVAAKDQLRKDRFPDLIDFDGGKVVEVKHVQGKLSDREIGDVAKLMDGDSQLADHLRMQGKKVDGPNGKVKIQKVEYVFVNPKGAAVNLESLLKVVKERDIKHLEIKVFSAAGGSKSYGLADVRDLNPKQLKEFVEQEKKWLQSR